MRYEWAEHRGSEVRQGPVLYVMQAVVGVVIILFKAIESTQTLSDLCFSAGSSL